MSSYIKAAAKCDPSLYQGANFDEKVATRCFLQEQEQEDHSFGETSFVRQAKGKDGKTTTRDHYRSGAMMLMPSELSAYEKLSIKHKIALRREGEGGKGGCSSSSPSNSATSAAVARHLVNPYDPIKGLTITKITTAMRLDEPPSGVDRCSVPRAVRPIGTPHTQQIGEEVKLTLRPFFEANLIAGVAEEVESVILGGAQGSISHTSSPPRRTANDFVLKRIQVNMRDEPTTGLPTSHQQAAARLAGGDTLYGVGGVCHSNTSYIATTAFGGTIASPEASGVSTLRPSLIWGSGENGGQQRATGPEKKPKALLLTADMRTQSTNVEGNARRPSSLPTLLQARHSGSSTEGKGVAQSHDRERGGGAGAVFVTDELLESRKRQRVARFEALHGAYREAILSECAPSKAAPRPFRTLPEPMV